MNDGRSKEKSIELENLPSSSTLVDDEENIKLFENTNVSRNLGFQKFCFGVGKTKEPKYFLGPHWYLFLIMYSLIAFVGFFVTFYLCSYKSIMTITIAFLATIIELFVYGSTAFRDPGICSNIANSTNQKEHLSPNYCKKCNCLRTNEIYHCEDCDVCIDGHDHHCIWTGKCIGKGNINYFYCFLGFTVIYIIVIAISAVL